MRTKRNYIEKAYGTEPEWDGDEETVDPTDILKAINWYNSNSQRRNYKKWTLAWMKDKRSSWSKEDIQFVRKCPLKSFRPFGHYCRMLSRGFPEVDQLTKIVETNINDLVIAGKNVIDRKAPTVSPRERMENQVSELAGELMNVCDSVLLSIREKTDYHKSVNVYRWLEGNSVTYWQAEMLSHIFAPALAELDQLVNEDDKQLKDGYSFLTRQQQKYLYKFMNGLVDSCLKYFNDKKPVRKKRKTNPSKTVAKVKYLKESKEFGIKSVSPSEILDSRKVLVFNCRYNTLSVYYARSGQRLSVKGTTIQNFDLDKSQMRTIKNANKEISSVRDEKSFESLWSRQTSVVKSANGRLNENCVILKAF